MVLDQQIDSLRRKITNTPDVDRSSRAKLLCSSSCALIERFKNTKSLEDIDEAIRCCESAVESSDDNMRKAFRMSDTAMALAFRFEATNRMEDSIGSIDKMKAALEMIPYERQERIEMQYLLAYHYRTQHLQRGSLESIQQAVQHFKLAVDSELTPLSNWVRRSYHLGLALRDLYLTNKERTDIDLSIETFNAILKQPDHNRQYRSRSSSGLARSLLDRFVEEKDRSEKDLQDAIDISQQLLEIDSADNSQRAEWQELSGAALYQRFIVKRSASDLETSHRRQVDALALTPEGDQLQIQRLNSLVVGLQCQYQTTGSIAALQNAEEYMERALRTPMQEHPVYPRLIHNLSELFRARYLANRSFEDLEQAISLSDKAAKAYRDGSREKVQSLNSYAVNIRYRYLRRRHSADFKEALGTTLGICEQYGDTHPESTTYFSNLAALYGDRYRHAIRSKDKDPKTLKILDEAIKLRQWCVAKTPEGSENHMNELNDLAGLYLSRFGEKQNSQDLDQCICNAQIAVNMTKSSHPMRGRRLRTLGEGHRERYLTNNADEYLQKALDCFSAALDHACSPPLERVMSGKVAADLAAKSEAWSRSAEYLSKCLKLLPKILLRSHSFTDHMRLIQEIKMLGPVSASVYLKAGRSAFEALQALEQNRSITAGHIMSSRSDVSMLQDQYPDQYSRYVELRTLVTQRYVGQTEESSGASTDPVAMTAAALQAEEHLRELEALETQIRRHPGFERFQLGPTEEDMHALAQHGPIVTFNITGFASHALIVTSQSIKSLVLPQVSQADVIGFVRSMPSDITKGLTRDVKVVPDEDTIIDSKPSVITLDRSLRDMWTFCVKPVLKELDMVKLPEQGNPLPEIWWVGGGFMALLPIHAAGDNQFNSSENTMKYAVSSYATSLKALEYSRRKRWHSWKNGECKIVAVAMPQTAGHATLETDRELDAIEQHIRHLGPFERLKHPTRKDVMEKLRDHHVVHLACHGFRDSKDPDLGGILVGKEKVEKLTIQDLQPVSENSGQLAYLSACSTADMALEAFRLGDTTFFRGLHLFDEGIRLADTFQTVGFRHVIGTLWSVSDNAAVAIAREFYKHLVLNGDSPSAVSRALHEAVMHRRMINNDSFDWAPLIHLGA